MLIPEIITELANRPAELSSPKTSKNGNTMTIESPELGLRVLFIRKDDEVVEILFSVGGRMDITGKGNQYKILSTAHDALKKYLNVFLKPSDVAVVFSADRSESSRVNLYNKIAPKFITPILGSGWDFVPQEYDEESNFMWVR